jgi:MFS family permease
MLTDLKIITVGEITALAFFLGTVNAFDVPARQSFLSEMVQKGRLMNAIALNSAAFNAARIIGPMAAGLTIAAVGIALCFYINAASFLAAIMALFMIKGRKEGTPDRVRNDTVTVSELSKDLLEGLRFVKNRGDVFRIMLLVATISLFGIPVVTFLPVFAEDILKVGPRGLGFLAAALTIAFIGEVKKKGPFMFVSGLLFCLCLLVFSCSKDFALSAVALALVGWGVVSFLAVANSFIQLATPDSLRGRVMSVYTLVFLGMAPVGSSIMGAIAHAMGTPAAVAIGALACFAAVLSLAGHLKALGR